MQTPESKAKPKTVFPEAPSTLAEVLAACAAPIVIDVVVRGRPLRLSGRRLTPGETAQVRALMERAMPPVLPAETPGGEERYDLRDPKFIADAVEYRRQARAFALFRAWPLFGEQAPDEVRREDPRACADWLDQSALEPALLDALFGATYADGPVSIERVSFT